MMGFDFADPESGISGTLRPSGAAILFDHDDVIAASAEAGAQLSDEGGEATVGLEVDGVSASLELSRIGTPISLRGERTGSEELAVCRVAGELRRNGEAQQLTCLGIRSDAVSEADPDEVSRIRSIAVAFSDGGILALRAARPRGAPQHGEEEIVAALADADGEPTPIREPLLSTHFDDDGRQLRATLELWPEEDGEPRPPIRAGGSIVCGTSMELGDRRLDFAFFRWSLEGRPGLGRYEIVSSPDA
jgi:hypothetical protein